jgi:hypothetical protein
MGTAVTESELQWIVHTVAAAILNPSEKISPSHLYTADVFRKVKLKKIDAKRLATRVKNRFELSEEEDKELAKFFECERVDPKEIKAPAVIVDAWGAILVWHLPDVVSAARVVSSILSRMINYLTNFRRR